MKALKELTDYKSRMKDVLDESWKIFKWQFAAGAFVKGIENEASFQFNFATIIRSIGSMYVLPGEIFYVDIETKWNNKKIDITCGFCGSGEKQQPLYNCAIELKFKRKRDSKGTFSEGRIFRMYRDIDYLEKETGVKENDKDSRYSEGRFYFITDNSSYMSRDDAFKQGGTTYTQPLNYKNVPPIQLNKAYPVAWDECESTGKSSSDKWYFLEIVVTK